MTHSNTPITLLILAGGLGSRYTASKQVERIGPYGEFLMEYAIYDAMQAGFNKVVIIVNSTVERTLFDRLQVQFASLELFFIKQSSEDRDKPWGTGHAVLCAKNIIEEPFMTINADDYYGQNTFKAGAYYLLNNRISSERMGLVAFKLGNTLSNFGGVSRGICQIDEWGCLQSIQEHEGIVKQNNKIVSDQSESRPLPDWKPVSMNCWLFHPDIFSHLQQGFDAFYSNHKDSIDKEYYLPVAVQQLIDTQNVRFEMMLSDEQWFGLTYAEDKRIVQEEIRTAVNEGLYPKQRLHG